MDAQTSPEYRTCAVSLVTMIGLGTVRRAPQPTAEQLEVFEQMIKHTADAPANHYAWIVAEMDDDGTMFLWLTEDAFRIGYHFDSSGERIGDLIL